MGYFDFSTTVVATQSRAAMIVFGNSAEQKWDLTTYASSASANSELVKAVNSLTYLDSDGTDILRSVKILCNHLAPSNGHYSARLTWRQPYTLQLQLGRVFGA